MALSTAQLKKVSSGRISDAADVMLDQTMHLIKCILLKHETAQLEVMAEMKEEIETLKQQRDHLESENGKQGEILNRVVQQRDELKDVLEAVIHCDYIPQMPEPSLLTKARAAITKVKP